MENQISPPLTPLAADARPDAVTRATTIYQVSGFEIFWRNFLAGMSRALGSILMYIVFLFCGFLFFQRMVYPFLKPYLDSYLITTNALKQMQQLTPGSSSDSQINLKGIDVNQINQLLQQRQNLPQ